MPHAPIKGRFGNQSKVRQLVSTESGFTARRSGSEHMLGTTTPYCTLPSRMREDTLGNFDNCAHGGGEPKADSVWGKKRKRKERISHRIEWSLM